MTLKKSYSIEIVVTATILVVAVGVFALVIPFDTLEKAKGLLVALGVVVIFIVSVSSALSFGYFLSKNEQGKPFTFKEFNPGITFSIKAIEKKEVNQKNFFLDDTSFQYIISCGDEIFLLTDVRKIPEGEYIKDAKTGRIQRIDTSEVSLIN